MLITEEWYSFEIPEKLEKLLGVRKKRNCADIYLLEAIETSDTAYVNIICEGDTTNGAQETYQTYMVYAV